MTKVLTGEEVKTILEARLNEAVSLRACAAALGVSPAYLSRVMRARSTRLGPTIVKALGYREVYMYERLKKGG